MPKTPRPTSRKRRAAQLGTLALAVIAATWWLTNGSWIVLAGTALEMAELATVPRAAWTILGLSFVLALSIIALEWLTRQIVGLAKRM